MNILVFNVGSTTLKFALFDTEAERCVLRGNLDRIGQVGGDAASHVEAVPMVLSEINGTPFSAIGHRVVQGGQAFSGPAEVTPKMLKSLAELDRLAPLHNPPARQVIEALAEQIPEDRQFCVFDTAYYSTLEPNAFRYAVPESLYVRHGVRRYGFHGTSHEYVTEKAIRYLDQFHHGHQPWRIISLHLGGGASATASIDGKAIDTTMGMTPLEGLLMATRCGDLDPSIPLYLQEVAGMTRVEVDQMLNKQSGLLGLCGHSDMRTVLSRCAEGDTASGLAVSMYFRRLQKAIGGFFAILGGLDGLVFTAGVGENSSEVRSQVVAGLEHLGVSIDRSFNESSVTKDAVTDISSDDNHARTLIIETNEELAIARRVAAILSTT